MSEPGVIPEDVLAELLPPDEKAEGRAVAVIECHEEIPCDTCRWVCPVKAVIKPTVTTPPRCDWDACIGCGTCVLACPGLAIFMVKLDGEWAEVSVPYEFLPVPKRGEVVWALDRVGRRVARAEVVRAVTSKDRTSMVTIRVPRELAHSVRAILPPEEGAEG